MNKEKKRISVLGQYEIYSEDTQSKTTGEPDAGLPTTNLRRGNIKQAKNQPRKPTNNSQFMTS